MTGAADAARVPDAARAAGSAPVARLADLGILERQVILYLRLWSLGEEGRSAVLADLAARHGPVQGPALGARFGELLDTTVRHARRPLMRHAVECPCAGADECVFARFVTLAAEGAREDAILIAALMVRADLALLLAGDAAALGLALARMPSTAAPMRLQ
jgi:hypothetical protein